MLGHAIFRDKPYDETRAQSQGYAAAASKMQKELDQMGGFKRFMVGLDPSLMANTIDKQLPGTIAQWQRTHGQAYRPGFFGRMAGMPSGPGTNPDANVNYFQTDAAGARHYL